MSSQLQKLFQKSIPENKIGNELYTIYDWFWFIAADNLPADFD